MRGFFPITKEKLLNYGIHLKEPVERKITI